MQRPTNLYITNILFLCTLLQSCYSSSYVSTPDGALQHRPNGYVRRHVHTVRAQLAKGPNKFKYADRQELQGGAPGMYGLATHMYGLHNRRIRASRPHPHWGRQRFIKRPNNMSKLVCFCDPATQKNRVDLGKGSLNIGTGDFIELVSGDVFVDKTLLIKDLLTDSGTKALLITRPRRWGKTLNMSMLYNFLRCEVREDATTNKLETVNPHPGLFDYLQVGEKYPELIRRHQGKWPVIFLTFKGVGGNSIRNIEQRFRDVLSELYDQHSYLGDWLYSLGKKRASVARAKYFSNVLEGEVDLAGLERSLYFLSKLLYEYHGRKVFVLLDEYDAPLNNTFLKPTLYEEVLSFMRGLLGDCFKDNRYLKQGIMTGILRIAKADLFSGINNFKEYSLLDKHYAEHFGFTDTEVSNLFDQPHVRELIEEPAPNPEAIKAWYNGYTIGGVTIYNPWSIMSCISEGGMLSPYWVTTGSDTLLRNLLKDNFELVYQVKQLLAKNTIEIRISPYINMVDMDHDLKFWSLMLAAGYVTLAGEIQSMPDIEYSCQVRIPNAEIKAVYESLIVGWFKGTGGIRPD
ncbi:MAG: AAA family ATPase [Bacteroidota bacterium]